MAASVILERLERFSADDFHLRDGQGKGVNGEADVCVMQAVAWLAGEKNTDRPECACPIISRYVIRFNDSSLFRNHRDTIKPYLPRVVGTRSTRDIERRRAFLAADYAVRVFAPARLRALKRDELATTLESVPPIDSKETAVAAHNKAREVQKAAAADADAYADVAIAADAAAYAAIAADADADTYAAIAADAAADVAAAADADALLRTKALECLDAMIAVSA